MKELTREEVLRLAKLAKIQLSEDEIKKYQKELSRILGYFEELSKVDTKGLEPTYQVTGLSNVTRSDEVVSYGYTIDTLLQNCKNLKDGQIVVDRMV